MSAALISAAISGVSSLAQTGMGIADMIRSGKKQKEAQSFFQKNKYEIPASARAALSAAERSASSLRMPGQDLMEQEVRSSTAQAVGSAREAASSGSDVLAMLSGMYSQEQSQMRGIGQGAASMYEQRQQQLGQALGTMAGLEQQKWQYNVLYPYQQMLGQAEALGTRGREAVSGGFGGMLGTLGSYQQLQSSENSLAAARAPYMNQSAIAPPQRTPLNLPSFNTIPR